ncbi:MAG TPA: hypothetical protein VFS17_05450 [Methylophilaceae bacterium]|nr:hypothetical protein [Methylophilaceae bacterium]
MPDKPINFNYENQLRAALKQIVRDRIDLITAIKSTDIPESDHMEFSVILGDTLGDLDEHNFADHGLSEEETVAWIKDGRPAGYQSLEPVPDHNEDPGAVIPFRDSDHGK